MWEIRGGDDETPNKNVRYLVYFVLGILDVFVNKLKEVLLININYIYYKGDPYENNCF